MNWGGAQARGPSCWISLHKLMEKKREQPRSAEFAAATQQDRLCPCLPCPSPSPALAGVIADHLGAVRPQESKISSPHCPHCYRHSVQFQLAGCCLLSSEIWMWVPTSNWSPQATYFLTYLLPGLPIRRLHPSLPNIHSSILNKFSHS